MSVRQQVEMEGKPLLQLIDQKGESLTAQTNPQTLLNATIMHRPSFAHVEVKLDAGQRVLGNWGAMLWMDGGLQMSTWCYGGFCNACCWRNCAMEHTCYNMYSGQGIVSFGFDLPGDILPFAATPGNGWVLTNSSFICGTPNTVVSAKFAGCCMCCFGGEGFFLTTISSDSGTALFYAGGYGQIQRHEVPDKKKFFINTGLFFAASDKTMFSVGCPGNCKSFCFSGEGFVMKFQGPLVLYTQNRDPNVMRKLLNPWRPPPLPEGGAEAGAGAVGS